MLLEYSESGAEKDIAILLADDHVSWKTTKFSLENL
jgi:hypothetical protein